MRTPFAAAVLGLLVLAGWAAWSAGLFDGELAGRVRTSSVYAAPGIDLDVGAAERVVGNRRLVVVFLDGGADLSQACEDTEDAAAGTLVMFFQPEGDELDHYGCSSLVRDDDEGDAFGKAFVAENAVAGGADQFVDRPLEAVKVVAVNYDALVKAGVVPDGARTIEPSAPRYVLAVAAVLTVVGGAVAVFLVGRRVGRLAAGRSGGGEALSDARVSLNAKAAVLAQRIIELDRRPVSDEQRRLAADYAALAADIAGQEGKVGPGLVERVRVLSERADRLADRPAKPRRKS